jgi:hypothetical protein
VLQLSMAARLSHDDPSVLGSSLQHVPDLDHPSSISEAVGLRKQAYRAIDNVTGGIIIAPEIGLPTDKEVEGGRDPSEPSGPTAVFAADA